MAVLPRCHPQLALDNNTKQMRIKIKELEAKAETKAAEDDSKLKEQALQIHTLREKLRARGVVLEQRTKELEAAQARYKNKKIN